MDIDIRISRVALPLKSVLHAVLFLYHCMGPKEYLPWRLCCIHCYSTVSDNDSRNERMWFFVLLMANTTEVFVR